MEAAAGISPPTTPIPTQFTQDSLDDAMQQVDDILKLDYSTSTETNTDPEAIPDPESQYTADSTKEESKPTAIPSPGRDQVP
jgi:hypothetical protein